MPPKKKGGKGKQINIHDFNDDYVPEDVYEWKEDGFATEEERKAQELEEKIHKRTLYQDRTTGNVLAEKNFRSDAAAKPNLSDRKNRDMEIKPPYVAHFGNLRNGTSEEEFLSNFKRDAVEAFRLVSLKGKTFACVEFKTAQAIRIALLMDGEMLNGRKLYVDFANEEQIERLHNNGNGNHRNGGGMRPSLSRDSAGQMQVGSGGNLANLELSRDAFGAQQPVANMNHNGMPDRNGSRSNFSSRVDLSELSRDVFGGAKPETNNNNNSNNSPLTGDGSKKAPSQVDLSNWRNEAPAPQPAPFTGNNNNNNNNNKKGGVGERGSPTSNNNNNNNSNKGADEAMTNWRDAPRKEQPSTEGGNTPAQRGGRGGGGRGSGGEGRGGGRGGNNNNNNNNAKEPKAKKNEADKLGEFRK